ncbi:MAG: ECF sigma factor [Rhodobacteraceae bacterium HLUCCA12]|nr:MAG: ECF sigma factor [Rhodobacteraceae bacterium HLUCCA12]
MRTNTRRKPVDNSALLRKDRGRSGIGWREVEDRLEEAAATLRRLPNPPGSGPKGHGSSWPEYVHEARHAYGYHAARMRVVPSARDIARMEEAIAWLLLIADPDDRRIVWMRAEGIRWREVCVNTGCSRPTAHRRWSAALLSISKALKNKDNVTSLRALAKKGGG